MYDDDVDDGGDATGRAGSVGCRRVMSNGSTGATDGDRRRRVKCQRQHSSNVRAQVMLGAACSQMHGGGAVRRRAVQQSNAAQCKCGWVVMIYGVVRVMSAAGVCRVCMVHLCECLDGVMLVLVPSGAGSNVGVGLRVRDREMG